MKCERCGDKAVHQEGQHLTQETGPDATKTMKLAGVNGTLVANVCPGCAKMLRKLGWKGGKNVH